MTGVLHGPDAGHAVQVVRVNSDNTLQLDEGALHSVLYQDGVKELPVAVVSVAGKFRQGKSFLLGFFLRYLQAEGADTWLNDESAIIQGFDWKGGQERVTTGIFIWSKPFIVQTPNHGKVAVVLMDSQGTDDTSSGMKMEVPIFALSTLLSSVLIFNVIKLARSDLENLSLFIDYGTMASQEEGSSRKPFQTLQFLVRDWNSARRHAHGAQGGEDYITNLVQKLSGDGFELSLEAAFSAVQCYLMPHPGLKVDSDDFEGHVEDIEGNFMQHIREFASLVLKPENLVPKEDFGGFTLTAAGWGELFVNYFRFFQSGKCPEPKKLFEVSRVDCYEEALQQARLYLDNETKGFEDRIAVNFDQELKPIIEFAKKIFYDVPKLGKNEKIDSKYSKLLQKAISEKVESLTNIIKQNKKIADLEQERQKLSNEVNAEKERRRLEEELKKAEEKKQKYQEEQRKRVEEQIKDALGRKIAIASQIVTLGAATLVAGAVVASEVAAGSALAAGVVAAVGVTAIAVAPIAIAGSLVVGGHTLYRWLKK